MKTSGLRFAIRAQDLAVRTWPIFLTRSIGEIPRVQAKEDMPGSASTLLKNWSKCTAERFERLMQMTAGRASNLF